MNRKDTKDEDNLNKKERLEEKLSTQETKQKTKYWTKTAEHSYETMISLFESKRYLDSLFYGHIVLEKILKAIVTKETKKQAPYTHNLVFLKELANLGLDEKEIDLLDKVNQFNIRARYPEEKLEFYKKCNKKFTEFYFKKIIKLYKKLCRNID